MKKYILPALLFLFGLSACTDDESSIAKGNLNEIVIGNLPESCQIISYEGNKLEFAPSIEGIGEDDLEFTWYLADKSKMKDTEYGNGNYEYYADLISNERNLSYEVNLTPGVYYVICEATSKKYQYSSSFTTAVTVSTSFTEGFYLLKETAGGDTELDFYNVDNNSLVSNLLSNVSGISLKGVPCNLSVAYGANYLNEDEEATTAHSICVVSESGDFRLLRTTDLKCVKDRSNILYESMKPDEKAYAMIRGGFSLFFVTDAGVRSMYGGDVMGANAGYYGVTAGVGGSKYIGYDPASMSNVHWDNTGHKLFLVDYNGGYSPINNEAFPDKDLSASSCVCAGCNNVLSSAVMLFNNESNGQKELYMINGGKVKSIDAIDPESHLGKGKLYSVNSQQAALIYTVDGNKVYGHGLEDHSETEYTLNGLPSDGQICYISNQYFAGSGDLNAKSRFDYLVVGIQNGNAYSIFMYETLGGQPYGNPVRTIKGEGKFHSIRYVAQNTDATEYLFAAPIYPFND